MSTATPSAFVLKQPNIPPSVPNPRYMIRKDGLVLAWCQDVWNVDQHNKKLLRCVRDLPASYLRRLNAIKAKAMSDAKAQKEYQEQFLLDQQNEQQNILARANLAQTSMQEITGGNLVAESMLQDQISADEIGNFDVLTAPREELVAYSRDELNVPVEDDQDTEELRRDIATMLGVQMPEAAAPADPVPPPAKSAARRAVMGAVE